MPEQKAVTLPNKKLPKEVLVKALSALGLEDVMAQPGTKFRDLPRFFVDPDTNLTYRLDPKNTKGLENWHTEIAHALGYKGKGDKTAEEAAMKAGLMRFGTTSAPRPGTRELPNAVFQFQQRPEAIQAARKILGTFPYGITAIDPPNDAFYQNGIVQNAGRVFSSGEAAEKWLRSLLGK